MAIHSDRGILRILRNRLLSTHIVSLIALGIDKYTNTKVNGYSKNIFGYYYCFWDYKVRYEIEV